LEKKLCGPQKFEARAASLWAGPVERYKVLAI
jgi:hypothetical protein